MAVRRDTPEYLAGYFSGVEARSGSRLPGGNLWALPDGRKIAAPDGRTSEGRGFWAAIRGEA